MSAEADPAVLEAREIIEQARAAGANADHAALCVQLAEALLHASRNYVDLAERRRTSHMARLMADRRAQAFATALTDRVHRTSDSARLVEEVRLLIDLTGLPEALSRLDRAELRALKAFGAVIPELTAAAVRQRLRSDAGPYVVSADPRELAHYLQRRRAEGVRVNLNYLGEEVLGESEAQRRVRDYIELLGRPDVDTISVKISSIFSQIQPCAWDATLARLTERLRPIYRAALAHPVTGTGGASTSKLVYLDMESYRDTHLTYALFRRLLDEPETQALTAGIVFQAYLPDSVGELERICDWAVQRLARGGAPIRVRLVKGANLAMEQVQSSLEGWPLPTYDSKHEVDANFKRLLRYVCHPDRAPAVHVGVGSHNVFDIAYALVLRASRGVDAFVEPEMLEGMAEPLRRAVQDVGGSVMVYAPSVTEHDFPSAVAYLVRRLDENTSDDNFLRHFFGMEPGDDQFQIEKERFVAALEDVDVVSAEPKRADNRFAIGAPPRLGPFANEPNTDFSQAGNRRVVLEALDATKDAHFDVHLRIAGRPIRPGDMRSTAAGFDPSRPGVEPYHHALADEAVLDEAITCAERTWPGWAATAASARAETLRAVANGFRRSRAELIARMVLDAGKRIVEADAEVSEAIDFAEYYARSFLELDERFETTPLGPVVITPPWNFPLAIPMSGTLAALVAGNAVILKPAPETVLVAEAAAKICWEAGVPPEVLQLIACEDQTGSRLIRDERVRAVVLTGATSTARLFRRMRPDLEIRAETGGKNAIFVSSMSDREQAVLDTVHSAFAHAGQKCSACSLLILESELYDDESFARRLGDAAESLAVGSAWEPDSFVTPLIRPPAGPLARAVEQLDEGESWLLAPRLDRDNPRLMSPGIKWGVAAGSFTHQTELFGPVLGVMRAASLDHAIDLANGTPYGLTGGIFSLDEREQGRYAEHVDVGNVYVNRPITGSIIGRQPFGGRKASSSGPGAKTGGPNYVAQLCHVGAPRRGHVPSALGPAPKVPLPSGFPRPGSPAVPGKSRRPASRAMADWASLLAPGDGDELMRRLGDYRSWVDGEISREHLMMDLLGEDDSLRYEPCKVAVVGMANATALEIASAFAAARLALAPCRLLVHGSVRGPLLQALSDARLTSIFDDDASLGEALSRYGPERVRVLGQPTAKLLEWAADGGPYLHTGPIGASGYGELRCYVKGKSISLRHHRYGNTSMRRVREPSA